MRIEVDDECVDDIVAQAIKEYIEAAQSYGALSDYDRQCCIAVHNFFSKPSEFIKDY